MNALSLSEGRGHIIAEHASAGGVQKEYIWLGDTPLAVFEGANLFYVHPCPFGWLRALDAQNDLQDLMVASLT
jgi:hypothetical protein